MDSEDTHKSFETLLTGKPGDAEVLGAIRHILQQSRENESTRARLADRNVIEALIEVVKNYVDEEIIDGREPSAAAAVRCLGNACAENPAGRDTLLSLDLDWARRCIVPGRWVLGALTSMVLYNMCSDCPDAQAQLYKESMHFPILRFLAAVEPTQEQFYSEILDVLFDIVSQKANIEPTLAEPLENDFLQALLDLPRDTVFASGVDNAATAIEVVLVYIRDDSVQRKMVEHKLLERMFVLLNRVNTEVGLLRKEDSSNEDAKLLAPLATSLVWCLSDMAARPEFSKRYALEDEEIQRQIQVIQNVPSNISEQELADNASTTNRVALDAACQVVGNFLWAIPPETYAHLTMDRRLHSKVFTAIMLPDVENETASLLHSAAGLLLHLTRSSPAAKGLMGSDELALQSLQRLCRYPMKEIQNDGARLLRALGADCPANQSRFGSLAIEVAFIPQETGSTETAIPGAGGNSHIVSAQR